MHEEIFEARLQHVRHKDVYRSLPRPYGEGSCEIDFASNDYLGFASQHVSVPRAVPLGASGSRLLTGNSKSVESFEEEVAEFFESPKALAFCSGYSLGVGVLAALARNDDIIILDQAIHACWVDGAKLSSATTYYFRHNDLSHLRTRLTRLRQRRPRSLVYVVVESIYSMGGDLAPLVEMSRLCAQFDALLIVDEAHGVGVLGRGGKGGVVHANLEKQVFARVVTFGKGLGGAGAVWLSSQLSCAQVVNFCHSFIYTTAVSPTAVAVMQTGLRYLKDSAMKVLALQQKVEKFRCQLSAPPSLSPILSLRMDSFADLVRVYSCLKASKINVSLIRSPTVRRGYERLRIVFHSSNSAAEVQKLVEEIKNESYQWI
ncbi:MAG: aminotransferase class I/II-fold pyridoxal phosphate-dependent enzyme [Zetaproteobacteria bacterium]|nr:aminotransferase class I/II-fold pyridoxal phosphate-dependent enzyme [Zetaproteobacteria bacterium]